MPGGVLLCAILAGAAPSAGPQEAPHDPTPTRESFEAGLGGVHELMERQRFEDAEKELQQLLEQHREREWVHGKKLLIEEDLRRCAFGKSYEPPQPGDVVSGRLLAYSPSSGSIRIRYTPDTLADLVPAPTGGKEELARMMRDLTTWGIETKPLVFPAHFSGPYKITVRGDSYPHGFLGKGPSFHIGLEDGAGTYAVLLGTSPPPFGGKWIPPQIHRVHEGDSERLEMLDETPVEAGKEFEFELSVSKSTIGVTYGGKKLLRTRVARGDVPFGFVALRLGDFSELTFSGKASPAWIQGLLDAHRERAQAAFERTWKAEEVLPGWLSEGEGVAPAGKPSGSAEPERAYLRYSAKVHGLGRRKDLEGGLALIDGLSPDVVSAGGKEYLAAVLHRACGNRVLALEHAARACREDPRDDELLRLCLELYETCPRDEGVIEGLVELARGFPPRVEPFQAAALRALTAGFPAHANRILERAAEKGVTGGDLESAHLLVTKALKGPEWPQRFEQESAHYLVVSDIDRDTCRDAARELERSLRGYQEFFRPLEDGARSKLVVFLFSGRSGYDAYRKDLRLSAPIHTAGCFSPFLKQVLVWNLPDRADMVETIRHEGFHQYLDHFVESAPPWLNEGLAEYFSLATEVRGRWEEGQVNADHVRLLTGEKTPPVHVKDLVSLDYAGFYRNNQVAPVHYAQSWALVHFLRHGDPPGGVDLSSVMEGLAAGEDGRDVTERCLGAGGWDDLNERFLEYLRSLR